ncbi:hypothetical protein TNCT_461441 [Trichonephila clavata]|uniref:Uncharacterized protein n=1 Tax=Trichonephila clavata TaxID=2740835 RepID=A0A8X6HFF0_TRICU|nr:hypothetical protein TNCT_461441 [Trichonephila clavata]
MVFLADINAPYSPFSQCLCTVHETPISVNKKRMRTTIHIMREFSLRMFTDILWKASKGIFDISALILDSAFASKRDLNFTTLPHSPPISDLIGYNGSKNVFPEWKETSDSPIGALWGYHVLTSL